MARIPLGNGKYTLIDEEDLAYLSRWKWQYTSGYATRAEYPKGMKGLAYRVLMHRVVLACPDKLVVDHINGDPLDNRRDNLRVATNSQNQWNKKLSKNNKSGHKGVCWDPVSNKWRAQVNMKEKGYNLGRFSTIEEAVAVRARFIENLHGEFARQA